MTLDRRAADLWTSGVIQQISAIQIDQAIVQDSARKPLP